MRTTKLHLFIASSVAFIILNTVENLIHFNIGRGIRYKDDVGQVAFEWPTWSDAVKITLVMLVFAALQGAMTCWLDGC